MAPATTRVGTTGTGTPSCCNRTLRNTRPRPMGLRTLRSCAARRRATRTPAGERVSSRTAVMSGREVGEEGGYRRVDPLLRVCTRCTVEVLIDRGVPERLVSLAVKQIDADHSLAIHVRTLGP